MEQMDLLALADFNLVARHGGLGSRCTCDGSPEGNAVAAGGGTGEHILGLRLFERGGRG